MIQTALAALLEVVEATLPVLGLILFFQLVVLRRVPANLGRMLIGVAMAMTGFFLFILGAKLSLIPMGIEIGGYLADVNPTIVLAFVFVLGVAAVLAEPAVRILAVEVDEVSVGSLRKRWLLGTIALGVGFALIFSFLRVFHSIHLAFILVPGYAILLALTLIAPRKYVPVAYDAGAVATGPVAVNFVLPLTTGMALGIWGDEVGVLGFGVVGIIAMCPIILMLVLGLILGGKEQL